MLSDQESKCTLFELFQQPPQDVKITHQHIVYHPANLIYERIPFTVDNGQLLRGFVGPTGLCTQSPPEPKTDLLTALELELKELDDKAEILRKRAKEERETTWWNRRVPAKQIHVRFTDRHRLLLELYWTKLQEYIAQHPEAKIECSKTEYSYFVRDQTHPKPEFEAEIRVRQERQRQWQQQIDETIEKLEQLGLVINESDCVQPEDCRISDDWFEKTEVLFDFSITVSCQDTTPLIASKTE